MSPACQIGLPQTAIQYGMRKAITVDLTAADRLALEDIVADDSRAQKHVWRADTILATADGPGTAAVRSPNGSGLATARSSCIGC